MKQVYKCEYCSFMGNGEEVSTHEEDCVYNPKNKSCATCVYGIYNGSYIQVGAISNHSYSCTYNDSINSLNVRYSNGCACEHYKQGQAKRIIAL